MLDNPARLYYSQAMTMSDLGQALVSVAILQYAVVPLIADLNRSHAANPAWPSYARFHVVSQTLAGSMIGLAALFFLWSGRVDLPVGICIATILSLAVLGSFFIALFSAPIYGGSGNAGSGIALIKMGRIDGNVANFGLSMALLLIGRLLAA